MRNSDAKQACDDLMFVHIVYVDSALTESARVYTCILNDHPFSRLLLQFAFNAVYKVSVTFMQIIVRCMLLPETARLLQAALQIMHRTRTSFERKCRLCMLQKLLLYLWKSTSLTFTCISIIQTRFQTFVSFTWHRRQFFTCWRVKKHFR